MKRTCLLLLGCVAALPAVSFGQNTQTTDTVVVTTDAGVEHPSDVFARIYSQTEQWRVVHLRDIHNGVRLLVGHGAELNDYLARLANNAAQSKQDWVFWSLLTGTLVESGSDGRAAVQSLAGNPSAQPWARAAAREALNGRFRP